jgi:integrase
VLQQDPTTRNGVRTLPLDGDLLVALRALRAQQARERLTAGEAYESSGLVVVDELGRPVHPEWYSDEFGRVSKCAGVKRLVLHEGRHTALSLMEKAGVRSRWSRAGQATTIPRSRCASTCTQTTLRTCVRERLRAPSHRNEIGP